MEKAEKVMQKVAKFNKAVDFPSPVFSSRYPTAEDNRNIPSSNPKEDKNDSILKERKSKHRTTLKGVSQLFKQPVLTVTFVLSFSWCVLHARYIF